MCDAIASARGDSAPRPLTLTLILPLPLTLTLTLTLNPNPDPDPNPDPNADPNPNPNHPPSSNLQDARVARAHHEVPGRVGAVAQHQRAAVVGHVHTRSIHERPGERPASAHPDLVPARRGRG